MEEQKQPTEQENAMAVNHFNQTMRTSQSQNEMSQVAQDQQSTWLQEQEKTMVREQLDLDDELERIEHLLRGHILKRNGNGTREWEEPTDKDLVVFSDYGIQLILNTIQWYLNKNTLLSHYDEDTILNKMKGFANALASTVFMKYEKIFKMPDLDECRDAFNQSIITKMERQMFQDQVKGRETNEEELKEKILKNVDVDKEIQKIKRQKMLDKLKEYILMQRKIEDIVHSTFLRALHGQERRTLRQHIHISETNGGYQPPQPKSSGGLLNWKKR